MTAAKTLAAPVTSNGPAESELGSAAQRERRKRILDATLALASKGGYDAVQMRAVAERADVALGTLYRYFPSKIHLLVSALIREFERIKERLDKRPIPGSVPADRIKIFAARLSQRLADRQNLAVGFATNWDLLAEKDDSRALAADAMRNATYALEALSAARALRNALAARIHVVRLVEGPVQGVNLEGEVLEITYAPQDVPHARPSSRAIAEEILRKL